MPWIPIADSGVAYEFVSDAFGGGLALMDGSVVSTNPGEMAGGIGWYIDFQTSPLNVRLTAQSYSAGSGNVNQFFWSSDQQPEPQQLTSNQAPSPTSWLPSPFELNIPAGQTNPFISNAAGEGEHGGYTASFLIEVGVAATVTCTPIGRTFKGIVSAYGANQVQQLRIRRLQKRCLKVDFNGAIPPGEVIESIRWDCTSPWATYLSSPAIDEGGRSAWVNVSFNYTGTGAVKATATLADGCILNYEFYFTVLDSPVYPGANYSYPSGPFTVTAP